MVQRFLTQEDVFRDGVGAQVQRCIAALVFARRWGLAYVHTPLSTLAHGEDAAFWERKLPLSRAALCLVHDCHRDLEVRLGPDSDVVDSIQREYEGASSVLFVCDSLSLLAYIERGAFDAPPKHFDALFVGQALWTPTAVETFARRLEGFAPLPEFAFTCRRLRDLYEPGPPSAGERCSSGGAVVVAHVRAGDIDGQRCRLLHAGYYAAVLGRTHAALEGACELHIVTDGARATFEGAFAFDEGGAEEAGVSGADGCVLPSLGALSSDPSVRVRFHGRGSEPLEASFDRMVRADVLVLARSSLSFVAGVLNERCKLYTPFWHAPAERTWLTVAEDGSFDAEKLSRNLRSTA
mmetsp:Transcript_30934/g.100739  ORF Transcript_30934/g.100739 Transcript_30934/m.100739 type:complete len:351 (+) Transcript_30934:1-1053(+)